MTDWKTDWDEWKPLSGCSWGGSSVEAEWRENDWRTSGGSSTLDCARLGAEAGDPERGQRPSARGTRTAKESRSLGVNIRTAEK